MNRRNKALLQNSIASIVLQIVSLVCGLILPRLVLSAFGSEVNGLNASIVQFLSYVTLLDGGIGGIVRAAYYKPLAENDKTKVNAIFNASQRFYNQLGCFMIIYSLGLAIIYPLVVKSSFSFGFVFWMVLILAFSTILQYFFGATRQILLHSNQQGYYNTYISVFTTIANTILCWIVLKLGGSIHMIKAISAIVYLVRPIVLNYYVKKIIRIDRKVPADNMALNQRWSAFARHIAFYIHTSTDISILTIFTNLRTVSIYSVHNAVIKSITSLTSGIIANTEVTFGDLLARKEWDLFYKEFIGIDMLTKAFSTIVYTISVILLTPFIMLYTKGIADTNYYQPVFAFILCAAEWIYCMGLNYNNVIVSAGHIKQTTKYAIAEALINLLGSIILVHCCGLIGVVIATAAAMFYKMCINICYMDKNIVKVEKSYTIRSITANSIVFIVSFALFKTILNYRISTISDFVIYACFVGVVVVAIETALLYMICRGETMYLVHKLRILFKIKVSNGK